MYSYLLRLPWMWHTAWRMKRPVRMKFTNNGQLLLLNTSFHWEVPRPKSSFDNVDLILMFFFSLGSKHCNCGRWSVAITRGTLLKKVPYLLTRVFWLDDEPFSRDSYSYSLATGNILRFLLRCVRKSRWITNLQCGLTRRTLEAKPAQLYVGLSIRPLSQQAYRVS